MSKDKIPDVLRNPKHDSNRVELGFEMGRQHAAKLIDLDGSLADISREGMSRFLSLNARDVAKMPKSEFEKMLQIRRDLAKLSREDQAKAMKLLYKRERELRENQKSDNAYRKAVQELGEKLLRAAESRVDEVVVRRVDKSIFPEFRKELRAGKVLFLTMPAELGLDLTSTIAKDWEREFCTQAQVFLMQHDWAGAFSNADLDAQFQLPYEVCAFEFQIGSAQMIALCLQHETDIRCSLAHLTKEGWLVHDFSFSAEMVLKENVEIKVHCPDKEPMDFEATKVMQYIMRQVRACCIALDAEVAVSEVQRERHMGKPVNRGHTLPSSSYHVVSLARRTRAPRLESEPTGRKVRLHFRRGHWRHFEDHKTWIKWMLVGDPELGFIDKIYKL